MRTATPLLIISGLIAVQASAMIVCMQSSPPRRRGGGRGGRGSIRRSDTPRHWYEEDSALIANDRRRRGISGPRTRGGEDAEDSSFRGRSTGQPQRPTWTSEASIGQKRTSFYSPQTFAEAGASEPIQAALIACGAKTPSHIQALGFKRLLRGDDVILADQTGSGKTLAYLAPLVQVLRAVEQAEGRAQAGQIRALVLVPTSELAQQVLKVAKGLAAGGVPFRSTIITGEHKWATQRRCADKGLELLIATPGRLHAHLMAETPSFSLSAVQRVVLDEVDILYDDVDFDALWADMRLMMPPRAAHAFVTATLPPYVLQAIKRDFPLVKLVKGPGLHTTRQGVREKLVDCSQGGSGGTLGGDVDESASLKVEALLSELEAEPSEHTLIFCNTIASCRRVENGLRRRDRRGSRFEVHTFHGAIPPEQRKRAIDDFTRESDDEAQLPRLLICTDRASRGMDFPQVAHVVLFDFPRDGVEYVRRVGRVTRGGNAPGRVTSLCLGRQLPYAKALMKANEGGQVIDLQTHS